MTGIDALTDIAPLVGAAREPRPRRAAAALIIGLDTLPRTGTVDRRAVGPNCLERISAP